MVSWTAQLGLVVGLLQALPAAQPVSPSETNVPQQKASDARASTASTPQATSENSSAPAATTSIDTRVTYATENGVLVVRRERGQAPPPPAPSAIMPDTAAAKRAAQMAVLAQLADQGLIAVRPVREDSGPRWAYKPKEYRGYHPKPDWTHHGQAGWRYDSFEGWRYRREPAWAQRPGAVAELLAQLPTREQTWYVTRWR